LESLCTQTLVIHVIRTAKVPVIESRASGLLVFTSFLILIIGIAIPISPLGVYFGFVRPSAAFFLSLIGITIAYLFTTQAVKAWYVKKYGY
jgi:Mg2+-importing ATPase